MSQHSLTRPHTTVVLAITVDGKIADYRRSPARFGSPADKAHLERQIAQADAVLFGAGTLRAYGSTLPVSSSELLEGRSHQGKPPQPIHIVCSQSANLDRTCLFFRQPVPRWLLTTSDGAMQWQGTPHFDKILTVETAEDGLNWTNAFQQFSQAGLQAIVVTGGGQLVASLLATDLIDELWLTVCPLILGGQAAPSAVEGQGFLATMAPRLELLSVTPVDHEVFLHYCLSRH